MTPLQKAEAEVARLTGIESQFNALQAQVPGGNLTALLTEHTRRGTELERLSGIEAEHSALLAQIPNGDVPAFVAEHTRRGSEIERLNTELESFDERVELRAAEMVAGTGNQPPPLPDNPAGGAAGADGKTAKTRNYTEHWSHYAKLDADEKNAYFAANQAAMTAL